MRWPPVCFLGGSHCSLNNINSVTTQDSVDNFSDHVPMFFTLKYSNLSPHQVSLPIDHTNSTPDTPPSKINWSKITDDDVNNFLQLLQQSLPSFPSTAHTCTDPQCTAHKGFIDHYCYQLLAAIDAAANACFPKILPRKTRRVPGWNVKLSETKSNLLGQNMERVWLPSLWSYDSN